MSSEQIAPIKKDWDAQPHINEKKGQHIIRIKEQNLLVDFIQRRTEGSLLVSGKRGVGKSSAVFSSIQEAIQKTTDEKIIPVLVIAPHFDRYDGNQVINPNQFEEFKKTIFQTLIRRLYKPGTDPIKEDKNIMSEVDNLYTKAVAKKVIEETTSSESRLKSEFTEKSSDLKIGSKAVGILLCFALIAGVIAILPSNLGDFKLLTSLLVGTVPTIAYSFSIKKFRSSKHSKRYNAQEYYRHDYDLSNIQSDLETLLKKMFESKYKVVFIIDELDKMNPSNVTQAVRSLKSLITNGYAIFIFVTGVEYFQQLEQSRIERSPDYTLFTQRIFLQRPLFDEMEKFIDGILDEEEQNIEKIKNDPEYNDFRNYLCYISKTDFFDLNQSIRDYIVGYNRDGKPLLSYKMDKDRTNFARLQKAMGQIYSRKAYSKPSDWKKNDLLLERLYWFLEKITSVNPGTNIHFPKGNPLQLSIGNFQPENITDDIEAGAIIDLITHLTRLEFFDNTSENAARITGTIKEVPKDLTDVISKEEQEFVNEIEKFQELCIRYFEFLGGSRI